LPQEPGLEPVCVECVILPILRAPKLLSLIFKVASNNSTEPNNGWPKTRAELEADLINKGYINKGTSPNDYTTYKGPDGRTVTVKPDGEVIELSEYGRRMAAENSHSDKTIMADPCLINPIQQATMLSSLYGKNIALA